MKYYVNAEETLCDLDTLSKIEPDFKAAMELYLSILYMYIVESHKEFYHLIIPARQIVYNALRSEEEERSPRRSVPTNDEKTLRTAFSFAEEANYSRRARKALKEVFTKLNEIGQIIDDSR